MGFAAAVKLQRSSSVRAYRLLKVSIYRLSETDESNVLNQTIPGVERLGASADAELKAGKVSIHSDLLLQSSEVNESNLRRYELTLNYCPADARAIWDGTPKA